MKRISPGTVTVAVLAIVIGLVAANMARLAMLQPVVEVEAPEPPDTLPIVVARVNMNAHTRIRSQDVQIIEVPKEQVPDGALSAEAIALSRVTRRTIMAGTVILDQSLFAIGQAPTLTELIPSGQRALTIKIEGSSPGGRLIEPDSLVDISLTVEDDHPDIGGLATSTLMRGVLVLASHGANLHGGDPDALIVAVTSEQANRLITAQKAGTLSVTLRSHDDLATGGYSPQRELVSRSDLLGLSPPPTPEPPYTVERWSGSRLEIIEIGRRVHEAEEATIADRERNDPRSIVPTSFGAAAGL